MDFSRRWFLGGLAALGGEAVLSGCRSGGVLAVSPGTASGEAPLLRFGVLSDIHVRLRSGGRELVASNDTATLETAFRRFREAGADAVVIAGDMADSGIAGELAAVAEAWYSVFPDDRAPDGRRVERVFVFGNHDWNGPRRGARVYEDEKRRVAESICTDPAAVWRRLFHEDYASVFSKTVRGFDFIGAHWCVGDCNGKSEACHRGLADFYAKRGAALDPSRPFFHVQHPHPRGTVHGAGVWGQDDGESTRILSAYPNAVAFSGHSHTPLTDERSIWQGAFTSVGCGSLRYLSSYGEHFGDCRQGQLVSVYADRMVFSLREFIRDVPLADDLAVPLPVADPKPFDFASRKAAAKAPAFAAGARLKLSRKTCKMGRGTGKKRVFRACEAYELVIPPAVGAVRADRYRIAIRDAAGRDVAEPTVVAAAGYPYPAADERARKPTVYRVACDELPASAGLNFEALPLSCWGVQGRGLKIDA